MSNRAPLYAVPVASAARAAAQVGDVAPVAPRKRGRPRDPQADIRILEAAAALILVHGFDNMTVDEVATRARVGKATVYRRWARKEDLALAALRQLYRTQLPLGDTGSVRGDLAAAYTALIRFAGSPNGRRHLRTAIGESMRDKRVRELYSQALATAEEPTRESLRKGAARGEVHPDVSHEYAVQWLISLLTSRTVSGRPLPSLDEVDELVEFVLRGVTR